MQKKDKCSAPALGLVGIRWGRGSEHNSQPGTQETSTQGPVTVAWRHCGSEQQKTRNRDQALCGDLGRKKVDEPVES